MRRSHVALLLVLGAPVALYAAILVPRATPDRTDEPTEPAAYFPTAVGTKWEYQLTRRSRYGARRHEQIEVITDARESAGERFVIVKQLKGDSYHQLREWAVSDTGVRSRFLPEPDWWRGPQGDPSPWYIHFPVGIAPGASWTEEKTSHSSAATCTIAGWETVQVPAGAYRALRVNFEIGRSQGIAHSKLSGAFWYAAGIGLVKFDITAEGPPLHHVLELTSSSAPPGQ